MSLIKDTSHLQIPYSSETPDEDVHTFMTIDIMVERTTKHQNHLYCFRTVGAIFCVGQSFYLQQLDDPTAIIRVSLKFLRFEFPYRGLEFTAHLFGCVHWKGGIGPVLFPLRVEVSRVHMCMLAPVSTAAALPRKWNLKYIPACLAVELQLTMERAIESYILMNPGAARWRIKRIKYE